jgi:hypothetical protein
MQQEQGLLAAAIEWYLHSRPRWVRWREWLNGRRYLLAPFLDRPRPLVIVAHSFSDAAKARELRLAVERDWHEVPERCREAYDEILSKAPGLVIVQLRRKNICGCLGHRHMVVREAPFAEPHEAFQGAGVGEMDIAYERVATWQALPLSDTALDARFLEGSRLEEFRTAQFRLRLLSILLHEINHLVFPHERETSIRERSLAFYRDALANYVENAIASMSLTIDRSFSRFGQD